MKYPVSECAMYGLQRGWLTETERLVDERTLRLTDEGKKHFGL